MNLETSGAGKPKYIPTEEDLMAFEFKKKEMDKLIKEEFDQGYRDYILERARKRGYEAAKAQYEGVPTKEKGPDDLYGERKEVNGIEIRVGWNSGLGDFFVSFPEMPMGDAASKEGVLDTKVKVMGEDAARKVFKFATEQAQNEPNIYALYKKVRDYSEGLLRNEMKEGGSLV